MALGDRLRQIRTDHGLSQGDLAEALGYTKTAISQYELGKRAPSLETLRRMTEFFGVTTDWLLGRDVTLVSGLAYKEETSVLGSRIRQLREEGGLTQAELAERLEVDRSTVTAYETGKREPNTAGLRLIASIFGVSVDYLLGVSADMGSPEPQHVPPDLPADVKAELMTLPPEWRDLAFYATRKLTPEDVRAAIRITKNVIDGMSKDEPSKS